MGLEQGEVDALGRCTAAPLYLKSCVEVTDIFHWVGIHEVDHEVCQSVLIDDYCPQPANHIRSDLGWMPNAVV